MAPIPLRPEGRCEMTDSTTQFLWTRQETAKRLGVCPHSVMNLEKRGFFPPSALDAASFASRRVCHCSGKAPRWRCGDTRNSRG